MEEKECKGDRGNVHDDEVEDESKKGEIEVDKKEDDENSFTFFASVLLSIKTFEWCWLEQVVLDIMIESEICRNHRRLRISLTVIAN
jgi:hypothetical protein